jgi:signal transduction histidine kinase/DNA-binding NarL/FixJ family response regulator
MKWKTQLKQEWQISLKAKITLAMTGLVSTSIIIATSVSLYRNQNIFRQELEQQADVLLTTLTISTAESFNLGNVKLLNDIIHELSKQQAILSSHAYQADGKIIADTEIHPEHDLNLADPLGQKILQSQTTFLDWQPDRLIAGKRVIVDNKISGAISVELTTASLQQKLATEKNQSLILALSTAAITSLITFYFSRSVTEPLKQIITATQYLASGGLDHEITVKSNDEFAILARTFNFMTSELRNMVQDLKLRAEALHQSEAYASDQALKLKITLDELRKAKVAAESANQAKSVFLSNMSHELRTPLNGIMGYAQILRRDRTLSPQQNQGLKIIYDSGNHLLTLINDILDLSKIEARKLELYPSNIHCSSFFNSIADIMRMQALEKDILFESILSSSLPTAIQADEKRLRQVLLNLLSNAVKFTEQGKVTWKVSTITLINKSERLSKHKASHDRQQTLRFEVIDTGVGISPKQLKKIFLPFEQVGKATSKAAGTGLGLAISMQLVTLMGGQIGVKSKPNQGSTFWFDITFPVVEATLTNHQTAINTESAEQEYQIVGYQGHKRKILVVDDKEENRLLVLQMLEPLGFEIILAENGQQEIDLAQQIQPDCILTDLVMPVKSGFEAVQAIRQIPAIQDVIIIAISASVLDADRAKSRIVGCEAFLPKPIKEPQLLSLLQEYLQLEWIYEKIPSFSDNQPLATTWLSVQDLIAPSTEEIEILYELAMLGNMKKIRERADYLETLDPKYIPFAQKLKNLAQGFQEKAIVNLVQQFL